VFMLKYVSGITLFLEKKETYRNYESSLFERLNDMK